MDWTLKGAVRAMEIGERVNQLRGQFEGDIERIDHRFGPDSTGDPSVFFTVHLTPQGKVHVADLARKFPTELIMQVETEEFGFHPYVEFVDS